MKFVDDDDDDDDDDPWEPLGKIATPLKLDGENVINYRLFNNSATDYSISLKFCA